MSQVRIKPRDRGQIRRLARQIPDQAALERALEGPTAAERAAMLARLRPYLKF